MGTLTFCWVEWLTHRDAILAATNDSDDKLEEERVSGDVNVVVVSVTRRRDESANKYFGFPPSRD